MLKRCLLSMALVLCCHAEDFTLADGTVLKDAEVLRQDAESLQIRHAGGIERFYYTKLSPELQQKYELTPEQVEARRAAADAAAEEKRRAKREAKEAREKALQEEQARREAALVAAGKYARYLRGADVIQLCSAYFTVDAAVAEFLAAEWNYREALRMNLPADAERFAAELETLKKSFEQELERLAAAQDELESLRSAVQSQQDALKRQADEIAELRAKVAQLNKELGRAEAENASRDTTVVIDRPVYVPTYVPTPVLLPRRGGHHHGKPHSPRRSSPRPRPVQVSPGARPANSAHTLPRR